MIKKFSVLILNYLHKQLWKSNTTFQSHIIDILVKIKN